MQRISLRNLGFPSLTAGQEARSTELFSLHRRGNLLKTETVESLFSIFSFYHLSIDPKITIFLLFRHFRPFPYRKFKGNFFQKTKKMTKKEGPGECPCASLISVCEGHLFGPSEIFSNCHRPRASKMPINSSRGQASYFVRRTDAGHVVDWGSHGRNRRFAQKL